MKNKQLRIFMFSFLLCTLVSFSYLGVFIQAESNKLTDNTQSEQTLIPNDLLNRPFLSPNLGLLPHNPIYPIDSGYQYDDSEEFQNIVDPFTQNLTIINNNFQSSEESIRLSLTEPTDNSWAFRGNSLTVSGQLRSAAPLDYWDGEDVLLFYNLTESQYLSDPSTYEADSFYYVDTDTTDGSGYFSFTLDTSHFTASLYSEIGKINLLTYFKGNPSLSRGAGSPGAANVTFYGRMFIDVISDVTNPGSSYSFTSSVIFDNLTTVVTQGTSYDLTVDWSIDGLHTDTSVGFGVTNQHTYTNTSPASGETVTHTAVYDISQLSYSEFFSIYGATDPTTEKTITEVTITQTEKQIVIRAYYVTGAGITNARTEVAIDSTVNVYANVTSDVGPESGKTVNVAFWRDAVPVSNQDYVTNGTGEIQFNYFVSQATFTNVHFLFNMTFKGYSSEYTGFSMISNASLNSYLAVNVTSISFSIIDDAKSYTTGMNIPFEVTLLDEYGNTPLYSPFYYRFDDFTLQPVNITSSGTTTLSTILVPDYSTNKSQTKNITIFYSSYNGTNFRYKVGGSLIDSGSFNLFITLNLTLIDPQGLNVSANPTWTELNNTFWNLFGTGNFYNLTVLDDWGRNPIGVNMYISFAGQTSSTIVTAGLNYVTFDLTDLGLTDSPHLLDTHAYTGLILSATADTAPAITQTITIYGPDNTPPTITQINYLPDPDFAGVHDPFYNITFTIIATDVGTGVRSVLINYQLYQPDLTPDASGMVTCFVVGVDTYQGTINMTYAQSQYYVAYQVEVIDYAGYGLDEFGVRQVAPVYVGSFGWSELSTVASYQVGDFIAPQEEQLPYSITSPDPQNPYTNITVYVNDSIVWTGMNSVWIVVNRTNLVTLELEENYIVALMVNNPGTNQWTYQLLMDYNYNYDWYYVAIDSASPNPNYYYSSDTINSVSAVDSDGPALSNLDVSYNGSLILPDSVLEFTVTASDVLTDIDSVTVEITYNGETFNLTMVKQGATDVYLATLDLADYPLEDYGDFSLIYSVTATDDVGNLQTLADTLVVNNAAPVRPPGGITGNIGGIVGGIAGGIIGLIAVLFLWFNRHTLQTYAKKQTFRRRLRDYLREIIEDIKKDGLEGRYKEGLLKTWAVVEGIGREFFDLPRYRSQTPKEFSRLLALKGKIERELLQTLLDYFEKARYGYEEITENDFNAGVRALLKIVDKIEVGEMKIES